MLVTCGESPAFPTTLAAEGGLELHQGQSDEVVAALAELKDMGSIDAPGPLQLAEAREVEWTALWWDKTTDDETLGLLVDPPESTESSLDSDEHATLNRQDGRWRASSWSGTCGARPAFPADREWAQTALPAGTSGRDPDPFLATDPVIFEIDRAPPSTGPPSDLRPT